MRFSPCASAAVTVLLTLLAVSCEPPSVNLGAPAELEPGTRIVHTTELRSESLNLDLSLEGFSFAGVMELDKRERLEVEVVSDSELRLVVREDRTRTGLTLEGDVLPSKTEHGPLEGLLLVARRAGEGWEVALAEGEPNVAQSRELAQLSLLFAGTGYPAQAMRPGDESELNAEEIDAAMGGLMPDVHGSGTVKLRGVESRDGIRGVDLRVTFYASGDMDLPGLDRATMELTLQGDVFHSLDHNIDLDYALVGEIAIAGAMHDARGSAKVTGKGRLTVVGHSELERP